MGGKTCDASVRLSMLILLGTFVLPQLAAFPVTALGWDPLAYQFTWPGWNLQALWAQAPVRTAIVFLILAILSIVIGMLWDKKRWLGLRGFVLGNLCCFLHQCFQQLAGIFHRFGRLAGLLAGPTRRSSWRSALVLLLAYPNPDL